MKRTHELPYLLTKGCKTWYLESGQNINKRERNIQAAWWIQSRSPPLLLALYECFADFNVIGQVPIPLIYITTELSPKL